MHTRGTNPRLAHQGAGSQGNIFSFRSRQKNALDIPSYRSGVSTNLRYFFAKLAIQPSLVGLPKLKISYGHSHRSPIGQNKRETGGGSALGKEFFFLRA